MSSRDDPGLTPALAEMLEADGELDRILDGRGLTFERVPRQAAQPPAKPFVIEPPDWEAEERERKQREQQRQQQERAEILEEELARIATDEEEGS